ncbi:MAG: ribosome rescue protein RqcH [Candidatus Hodarchaeales archaeon]
MSSLDIYAISNEIQGLVGYRIANIYRDTEEKFFLFKFKGKGQYKNPFLLIEPGIRIHLTEVKYPVPERPSDKILGLRSHLKGTEVIEIHQIDFDRLIEITLRGKQQYRVYIEIFGNRPNFIVVGNENQVISAHWYKKMRHRDILPGKKFELPPSRGKSILDMTFEEINQIVLGDEVKNEEIVRTLAKNLGGGGGLMEEVLTRANIPKNKKNNEISDEEINQILQAIRDIQHDLEELKPSVALDLNEKPTSFQPIDFESISEKVQYFDSFSLALDFFYSNITPEISVELKQHDQKRNKLLKVLKSQKQSVEKFEKKKKQYKEIGDRIYLQLNDIGELLSTIVTARRKNIDWPEIQNKLAHAKTQGILSAKILKDIDPERGTIQLNLDSEIIEVDFRKSATDIANEYYQRAKKAARKIQPANEAILETERKIDSMTKSISEQRKVESFSLKRRKRKWFEKYHWSKTQNGFLIIGGKDISSNEEIVKRRMKENDIFFHTELRGAPYTILIRDTSEDNITEKDFADAALLAAAFSSGWKAGYGAVDVYHVPAKSTSFTAPSGEYIPKGGIMIRGRRTYIRGVEMALAIGVQIDVFNATVIYGSEEKIRSQSPITVIIKPGSVSKGKIAKQIHRIFVKKLKFPGDKAKIRAINLNEFVQAIPHDSVVNKVEYGLLEEEYDSN